MGIRIRCSGRALCELTGYQRGAKAPADVATSAAQRSSAPEQPARAQADYQFDVGGR